MEHKTLKNISTEGLRDRLNALVVGPVSLREAHKHFCGCDENCPWDSVDAVERELMERA